MQEEIARKYEDIFLPGPVSPFVWRECALCSILIRDDQGLHLGLLSEKALSRLTGWKCHGLMSGVETTWMTKVQLSATCF